MLIKYGPRQETGCIYSPSFSPFSFLPLFFPPPFSAPSLHLWPLVSSVLSNLFLKRSPSCLFYFLPSGFLSVSLSVFFPPLLSCLCSWGIFCNKNWKAYISDSRRFRFFFFLFRQKSCCYNLCPLFPLFFSCLPVVLPPTERALLPRAKSPVLRSRDRQRARLPPLPQHRLQRPEAREHPAGLAGTHHPYRFRPLQGEHRTQRDHVDLLWYARGKDERSGDSDSELALS